MFGWLKRRRRRKLLADPFPDSWLGFLESGVRQYRLLTPAEQAKLRDRVRVFVAEKRWEGCGGLQVTDEMKVVIAAQACLLLLGIDADYHYDRIRTILVYPDTYLHPPEMSRGLIRQQRRISGEYWHGGPIIVSWSDTRDPGGPARNLVFHEFAHHLDDLDGAVDGMPPLESRAQVLRWDEVLNREYRELVESARRGRATLLDPYGATSRGEFFAVASECFFERPIELQAEHPELYDVLRVFYRQDPAAWSGTT